MARRLQGTHTQALRGDWLPSDGPDDEVGRLGWATVTPGLQSGRVDGVQRDAVHDGHRIRSVVGEEY